jgi:hypothetical protein
MINKKSIRKVKYMKIRRVSSEIDGRYVAY